MKLKTLQEINNDFMSAKRNQKAEPKKIYAVIASIMFYLAVFLIFIMVLTFDAGDASSQSLFGYSYFTVVSGSMEDEIPNGSVIFVKSTDPQDLNVDDNITFIRDKHTTVTHKVINIYEDYDGNGARGFQTKGVNNINPDKDAVNEEDVIGKVTIVIPGAGKAIAFINERSYIIFIILGLWLIISFGLRGALPTKGGG